MGLKHTACAVFMAMAFLAGCREQNKENSADSAAAPAIAADSAAGLQNPASTGENQGNGITGNASDSTDSFELNEDNAIDFFYKYQQGLAVNRVRVTTSMGAFTIELYDNVPYHKSNFIYLSRKGYFDSTMFHRVVRDFIIQGGNADNVGTSRKRGRIGRYLLPPDTRKGHSHHRGTVSMPSSEIDNPHMLASPYEFFIVVTDPGSYHLDGEYTPFGRVIEGMDVVDAINQVDTDDGDWPMKNIYILKAEVLD